MSRISQSSTFTSMSHYPCSAKFLYDLHSRPGALERLLPPWENNSVISKQGGIEPGGEVKVQMKAGPLSLIFHARHVENSAGEMFRDIQEHGPFSSWSHSHFFRDTDEGATLEDRIEYALPGHKYLPSIVKNHITKKLQRLFVYREHTLKADIDLHMKCSNTPLKILISGASGVLGKALIPLLTTGGHSVWTLVRRRPDPAKNEIFWDPAKEILFLADLPEIDGVIHLAGEYIGLNRWSDESKKKVLESRTKGTDLLCRTIAKMEQPPRVFLSSSAVGFYGESQSLNIDENRPPGNAFISTVCHQWEQATQPAKDAGIRTVLMRMGVGITPQGGALKRMLGTSHLGFMRYFGSGNQYVSWISSDDLISAMLHILTTPSLHGPVNITAPTPVTNRELMGTLAKMTGRPLLFPVPATLAKAAYGQMAEEIILCGCHVSSAKLQNSGFIFRHPTFEIALKNMLGLESQ